MLVCGLDEAGRGCVLGSLFVVAVVIEEKALVRICVKDSKRLTPNQRARLYKEICTKATEIVPIELSAERINEYHQEGLSLNDMEIICFTEAINMLESTPVKIYVDSADVVEERFSHKIREHMARNIPIISKHKADALYPVVSASSILSKFYRDRSIKNKPYGSGYPSDPHTIKWLHEYYTFRSNWPKDTRLFWRTLNKIKNNM